MPDFLRAFGSLSKADVALAGGKGASLGEMTQAGIPVPPGFVVLAPAFDRFLDEARLREEVEAQLSRVNYQDVATVERASAVIHDLIHDARFPADLEQEVVTAFQNLGAAFVAVRSSATAEDSSIASWAGELESYLNTTEGTLIENIKKCWASLFTPRAIVYRNEKGLRDTHVSVAVVVQKMVQSDVSGITFTVHPVTKDHNQMIIEACWGLGELIVGGMVTPDSYVIDKRDGREIDVNVSEQEEMLVRGESGNGMVPVPSDKKERQKLTSKQLGEIGDLCLRIEKHYAFPCDIEWGMEGGTFFILQSRPITTLGEGVLEKEGSFDGHEWFMTVTRNMSFWHQCLSNEGNFHHQKDFNIGVPLEILTITENGTQTTAFMHQPNYNEFGTAVLQSVHTREGVDQLKECYENYANALLDALKSVDEELNLETLTLFNAQYRRFCAGLTISMLIGRSGGELLMKQLKEKGVLKDKIPEMIAAITYPETHTPLFESQSMLLQIAADFQMGKIDDPTLQHRLKGWVDDHGHVPVNFCDEPWTIVDAHVQLQQLLKKNCSDELKRLLESHGDRITRARQILNELQDESVSTLAHAVAVGTYLNEFRKTVFSKVSLGYRNFFKRIAQLGGSDDWRDCFYLTPAEMLEMVDGRKIELSGLVQERRVAGMYVSSRGTSVLLDKETTSLFLRIVESSRSYTDDENIGDTIEGFSANGGRVKGIARIIYSSRDFQKLLPGDILVTTMTSVDFVPIMERASAFVCNEGGITSHASIVAREMNKPCIIGTKIATKVLKDGDLVEVDATQGIVKIIQRA